MALVGVGRGRGCDCGIGSCRETPESGLGRVCILSWSILLVVC